MTNAKSRLVRIIALALVVLMVVPMALVGCGKTVETPDNSAEIEAALAAAQAAKDAADKAAADAQAAIDAANKQIEEAKKAAADAQAKAEEANKALESMKNTTTTKAPATTTAPKAPEVDKVVLDAHIADILQNKKSEFNKLADKYMYNVAYAEDEQEAIKKLFTDAQVAILRADTVDYANQLVANLAAALEKVPTFVEIVKAAYDAIDFASDVDVIDVVYAYNLLKLVSDKQATELSAYGEDKVDVATAIKAEYARYTGVDASTYAVADSEVLYKSEYQSAANLAKEVADIYQKAAGAKLDVKDIVYFATIKAELDGAVKAYQDWAKPMKDDVLAIYADLCIAFAGEKYILDSKDADYLNDALAAAQGRVAEILVAVDEFKDTILKPLAKVVKDGYANADYIAIKNKDKVDNVADLLAAWIAKYDFDAKKAADVASIDLISSGDYSKFVAIEKVVDATYALYEAALALNVKDIEKAYDEFTDDDVPTNSTLSQWNVFSYNDYFAAVEALELWYYGSWKNATERNADGFVTVVESAANRAAIIDEVFDITEANLVAFIGTDGQGYRLVKAAKSAADALNRAFANVDTDEITNAYYNAIKTLQNDAETWVDTYLGGQNIVEDNVKVIEDMINYDLIDWDAIEVLWDAYDATIADIKADSIAIVETYIALYGEYDAEEGVVEYTYKDEEYAFDFDPMNMSVYFNDTLVAMKAVYEQLAIAKTAGQAGNIFINVETVEGEDAVFTLNTVIDMYLAMHQEYYYVLLQNLTSPLDSKGKETDTMLKDFKASTFLNAAGWNDWKNDNVKVEKDDDDKYVGTNTSKENQTAVTKLLGYLNDTDAKTAGKFFEVKDGNVVVKGTSTKIAKSDLVYGSYSMVSAYMAVDPMTYATKDSKGVVTAFDGAKYVTAVNAKINEYKAKWVELHIADLKTITISYNGKISTSGNYQLAKAENTTVLEMAAQQIQYISQIFLAYGLWNIADEVEIDGEVYTFELVPNNDAKTALALVMYDEDGDVVPGNKIAFTKIENGANVNYEYVITPAYGKDVQIMAVGGKVEAVVPTSATPATVALSAIDDAEDEKIAPTFIYKLADNLDEIFANYAKFSSVKKPSTDAAYITVTREQVETVLAAYETNKFYGEMQAIVSGAYNYADINTIKGETYGTYAEAVIEALEAVGANTTEFKNIMKTRTVESYLVNKGKVKLGANLDELKTICKTLAAEADALAAEILIEQAATLTGTYQAPDHANFAMFK